MADMGQLRSYFRWAFEVSRRIRSFGKSCDMPQSGVLKVGFAVYSEAERGVRAQLGRLGRARNGGLGQGIVELKPLFEYERGVSIYIE